MIKTRRWLVLSLAVAAAVLALTACGGSVSLGGGSSPASTDGGTTTSTTTYTTAQHGFAITSSDRFTPGAITPPI